MTKARYDVSLIAGKSVYGVTSLGVLGSVIRATTATGSNGPGILYNDWDSAADDAKEFRTLIVTPPSGVLNLREDGSFDYTGATSSWAYQLYVDGVAVGAPATATVTVGAVADAAPPTLTGSITISSVTPVSYTLAWPVAADNVGVAGYDYSLNGGTSYTALGNVLTVNVIGRSPGSTDQIRVRARDAAGNTSTPNLSASVTLGTALSTAGRASVIAFRANGAIVSLDVVGKSRVAVASNGELIALVGPSVSVGIDSAGKLVALV